MEVKMDIISIKNLEISSTIGCYEWEKQVAQKFNLDLDYALADPVKNSDDQLNSQYDYAFIAQAIAKFLSKQPNHLLESIAASIADFMLNSLKLPWVRVTVRKPYCVPNAKDVSICIERGEK
jgi:7,8-dihydroneopterin aldolase/epimerase/oxygenase